MCRDQPPLPVLPLMDKLIDGVQRGFWLTERQRRGGHDFTIFGDAFFPFLDYSEMGGILTGALGCREEGQQASGGKITWRKEAKYKFSVTKCSRFLRLLNGDGDLDSVQRCQEEV